MKKRVFKIFISCLVLCMCMALAAPVAHAEGNTTYVISFRPGEHGRFSQGAADYLSRFGAVQTTAAGNLFLEVESGTAFPAGILAYLGADEGYYYRDGLMGGPVTEDMTYVAQFGILSNDAARYTVRYVDRVSGAEVAESYTGYANVGDVILFAAKTVPGYNVDSASKSITVSNGAELSFYYTSNGTLDEIHYVYGENTVVTQTVTNVAGNNNNNNTNTTTQNTPENTPAPPANTPAPTEIGDENVPLSDGQDTEPVQIDDENVPLSASDTKAETHSPRFVGMLSVGLLLLLGLIAAIVILGRKKKKNNAQ